MRLTAILFLAMALAAYGAQPADPLPPPPNTGPQPAAQADTLLDSVTFVDDLKLHCEILREDKHGLLVRVECGTMRLGYERVKEIAYDLSRFKDKVSDKDPKKAYDFAKLAERQHALEDAVWGYEKCVGKTGVPPQALLGLAHAYEELGKLKEAREAYQRFLRENADTPLRREILEKLRELEQKDTTTIAEVPKPAPDPTPQPTPDPTPAKPKAEEGLETSQWSPEAWGNETTATVLQPNPDDQNKVLVVDVKAGALDKAAVKTLYQGSGAGKTFRFDVYNPGDAPVYVAVAFTTNPGWKYFESRQFMVRPKSWTLDTKLDLTQKLFKCTNDNWIAYTWPIENLDSLQNITLLVYTPGKNQSARLFFDAIFLQ